MASAVVRHFDRNAASASYGVLYLPLKHPPYLQLAVAWASLATERSDVTYPSFDVPRGLP